MKRHPHVFVTVKIFKWPVCRKCGFIYLKNATSVKRASRPCTGTPDDD